MAHQYGGKAEVWHLIYSRAVRWFRSNIHKLSSLYQMCPAGSLAVYFCPDISDVSQTFVYLWYSAILSESKMTISFDTM